MNRDELLDKLAMEMAEWPTSIKGYPNDFPCSFWGDLGEGWECFAKGDMTPVTKKDWLQRRTELINCPPDREAPEWAQWKCQEPLGSWMFFEVEPTIRYCGPIQQNAWWHDGAKFRCSFSNQGTIIAGHDWRTTLTRINRDDNTSTPEEDEEFERIQARQDANKPHEADARNLDSMLADAMGKQPRYLDATGEDWIDEFARTATLDEFRGAMRFTIGKYNRRVGRKDEILKEVRKMKDYCARWEAYELSLIDQ